MKLLKFSATWCGPCKMQATEFKENPLDIEVEEINIDTNENELISKYNVRSIPTMVLVDDEGNELSRWIGFTKSDIIKECIDVHNNT